jgi:hypothetical protein
VFKRVRAGIPILVVLAAAGCGSTTTTSTHTVVVPAATNTPADTSTSPSAGPTATATSTPPATGSTGSKPTPHANTTPATKTTPTTPKPAAAPSKAPAPEPVLTATVPPKDRFSQEVVARILSGCKVGGGSAAKCRCLIHGQELRPAEIPGLEKGQVIAELLALEFEIRGDHVTIQEATNHTAPVPRLLRGTFAACKSA